MDLKERKQKEINDFIIGRTQDLTEEEKDAIAESVYVKSDFKRNIIETSKSLGIPEEICELVIKHYIRSVIGFMFKVSKYKITITIPGAMFIDLNNFVYYQNSKFYYIKNKWLDLKLRERVKKFYLKNKLLIKRKK